MRSVLLLLLLAGCSGTSSTPVPEQPQNQVATPTESQQSTVGMGTVAGRALSLTGQPLGRTVVRLAEVTRGEGENGAFILDAAQSPGTMTDDNGNFTFLNVPPREYVVVVGDVEGAYKIVTDETGYTKVWKFVADEVTQLGDLKVDLQP